MHLLGHSWGGFLAATYAVAQSEGLRSLVLASPLISVDRWLQDATSLRSTLPAAQAAGRIELGGPHMVTYTSKP
jgi:alpha-beta hydrolase superfamily lysophospholipase